MFKKFILAAAMPLIVIFGAGIASAQTAPVSGRVELKKADGTVVPVQGALVEIFRTDIRSSGPADKTDKKGVFNFAGLALGATYVISVSAPGAAPQYLPNVKAGQTDIRITLSEGDGRRLTPEEVREAIAKGAGGEAPAQMSEEEKKAQAEYEKKVKEIQEKNAKIQQKTAIIEAALRDGNNAYQAKNWDLAIAKYEEGIEADPDFAGSAPVLLNNKGAALRERAVITYNQNVKNPDASAKVEAFRRVKEDLGTAAATYARSLEILKNAQPGDIADPKLRESQMAVALRGAADTFRLMTLTEQVDETKIELAKALIPEYVASETDPARKAQARVILADMYRILGDSDNAIAEYRKVVEEMPDNLDALAGLGLSLVNAGYINNNKEQLQEGANYLQKYASAAPDGHKYKNDAIGLIESLKAEQKITPQKVTTPTRRRNN
jgi:tetratricopeptide (TPR) repeat protein